MPYTLTDPETGFSGIYPTEDHQLIAMCEYVEEQAKLLRDDLISRFNSDVWRTDDDVTDMLIIFLADDKPHTALQLAASIVANRLIQSEA